MSESIVYRSYSDVPKSESMYSQHGLTFHGYSPHGKNIKEGRSYFESGSPIDSSLRVFNRKIFEGQLLDDGSSGGTDVKGGDDTGNFRGEGAASFVHSPRMTDELSEWVT